MQGGQPGIVSGVGICPGCQQLCQNGCILIIDGNLQQGYAVGKFGVGIYTFGEQVFYHLRGAAVKGSVHDVLLRRLIKICPGGKNELQRFNVMLLAGAGSFCCHTKALAG